MGQQFLPFVRVVLPTYNRVSLVVGAIESVLAQSFSNFEVIVSNDGSRDETQAVVEGLAEKDSRIKIITNPNGGLPVSRNRALAVPGEYDFVAFLDDDDRWVPHHLQDSLDLFHAYPELDFVFARVRTNDLTGKWTDEQHKIREQRMHTAKTLATESLGDGRYVLSSDAMWKGVVRNELGIHPSTVLVRRSSVKRPLWFDPTMWFYEDLEFFLFLIRGGCRFGFIDEAHVNVYYQGDNMSGGSLPLLSPKMARKYEYVVQIRRMVLEQCETFQDRKSAREVLSKRAYVLGQCYMAQGQKDKARRAYGISITAVPTWRACKGYLLSLLPESVLAGLCELRANFS